MLHVYGDYFTADLGHQSREEKDLEGVRPVLEYREGGEQRECDREQRNQREQRREGQIAGDLHAAVIGEADRNQPRELTAAS